MEKINRKNPEIFCTMGKMRIIAAGMSTLSNVDWFLQRTNSGWCRRKL